MYGTLIDAETYFSDRIHVDAWGESTDAEKTAALNESRQRMDLLNYKGTAVDTDVFPRYYGSASDGTETVPGNIKTACYECAYSLLDGVDPEYEQENLAVTYETIAGTSTSYARGIAIPEHFASGIPSAYAWRFLKYYLSTPGKVDIYRV